MIREALTRIARIATGEDQVADDDTGGLAVIAEIAREALAKPEPDPLAGQNSSTYGEAVKVMPLAMEHMESHIWDNMSVWQQRDWLLGEAGRYNSLKDAVWPGKPKWEPTPEHPQQDFFEAVVESLRNPDADIDVATPEPTQLTALTETLGAQRERIDELERQLAEREPTADDLTREKSAWRDLATERDMADLAWRDEVQQLALISEKAEAVRECLDTSFTEVSKVFDKTRALLSAIPKPAVDERWVCDNPECRAEFAEYINGCPKCSDKGLHFSVRQPAVDATGRGEEQP